MRLEIIIVAALGAMFIFQVKSKAEYRIQTLVADEWAGADNTSLQGTDGWTDRPISGLESRIAATKCYSE